MSLFGALAEKDREGKEVYVKEGALDSSGQLAISPGFSTIDAVSALVKKSSAPTTQQLSWEVSGGTVTVYGWEATASGDTALTATSSQETVSVTIIGRRR